MLVICHGMIRSGSTAQYNVARLLVERAGVGAGQAALIEAFPDGLPGFDALAQDGRHFVFKLHDLDKFSDRAFLLRIAGKAV